MFKEKDSFFDCISEQQNLLKYIDVYMMLQHIRYYQKSNDLIFYIWAKVTSFVCFWRISLIIPDNWIVTLNNLLDTNSTVIQWHSTVIQWVHIRSTKYFRSGQLLFPTVWLVVSIVQSQQTRWFEAELGFHQVWIYLQGMILQNSLIIM